MNHQTLTLWAEAQEVVTPVEVAEQFVFFGAAELAAEVGLLSEVAAQLEEEARQYFESHPLYHFGRRLA
jgi:hypothetical protein